MLAFYTVCGFIDLFPRPSFCDIAETHLVLEIKIVVIIAAM
jgi:hypothetical protein